MKQYITPIMILAAATMQAADVDTLKTVSLMGVEVVSTPKEMGSLRQQTASSTSFSAADIAAQQVTSLKNVSAITPNFFIPNYGSRITSAVYIRGIGSRINTPAVGLYVDNIPYVDKSAFDFNFYDIERIDVLRGPQATLYGRNAMGGIIKVHTKNPFRYQGTDVNLSYNTGNNRRAASLTHYHLWSERFAFSAGGYYEGTSGFFKNSYTDKRVDKLSSAGGRFRTIFAPNHDLKLDLSAGYDYTDEGAYPYFYQGAVKGEEQYADNIGKITNNRESRYRRSMVNAGLNVEWQAADFTLNSVTGFQHLNDRMFLDQDFLSADIYSLEQKQRVSTLTQEVSVRSKAGRKWQWLTGASFMYQALRTQAPVTFYQDGLRWLEGNINTMMPDVASNPNMEVMRGMGFQSMAVNFRGSELRMDGTYRTPTTGLALYHQSTYNFTDRFSATAGLRLDYEHRSMTYDSPADVDYGFNIVNTSNALMAMDLQQLESHIAYRGRLTNNQTRLLPKFALKYEWKKDNNVYASVAMGQRSGGYNLQMFSDLLQGSLRNDMMSGIKTGVSEYMNDLMVNNPRIPKGEFLKDPLDDSRLVNIATFVTNVMAKNMPDFDVPTSDQVVYKPEYSWNYELGLHLTPSNRLQLDAALFYSRISNQQIARFVNSGLGRMMVNAGKSHSCGAELSVRYRPVDALALSANYGFTNSRFDEYDDGYGNDYADNYVPFVPKHTVNADAAYTFAFNGGKVKALTLGLGYTGAGRIYWMESNEASQAYYSLLSARASLELSRCQLTLWGRNLTDTSYNTFYFHSVSRAYEQHGAPFHLGVDLRFQF